MTADNLSICISGESPLRGYDDYTVDTSSGSEDTQDILNGSENEPIYTDIENNEAHKPIVSNSESMGWLLPKVKLVSWDPEDEKQWQSEGKSIANRNLIASIPNLACAFGVWMVWSVIVSQIQFMHDQDPELYPLQDWGSPKGTKYKETLYLLPAVAGLSGGTLRIPNAFMTQVCGGRNVIWSTSLLLCIPMVIAGIALQNPMCPYNVLLAASLLTGVGGGALASSMSNISYYYPKRQQGYALGMNGGLGNLGVSISQLLVPMAMSSSYGRVALSPAGFSGWPANAGWLWFPLCAFSSVLAFFWMSNQPNHGGKSSLVSHFNFWWMEIIGIIVSFIGVVILIFSRNLSMMKSCSGQVAQRFLLVLITAAIEHIAMWFLTPPKAKEHVRKQAEIFKDKHTWVMTCLYTMSTGSWIGYAGALPKLITDIFGYIEVEGCTYDDGNFQQAGELVNQETCESEDYSGIWGTGSITNPNAPSIFMYAWTGAAVGSIVRPLGGILADKLGGSKCTMVAIIWCTIATILQGILVQKTRELSNPEINFGWFLFLFLNLFFCTGVMNGTTCCTISKLFEPKLCGSVLGWSSAIASYGAFIVPSMFGVAIGAGKPEMTFFGLAGFYILCALLNFWFYIHPGVKRDGV